MRLQSWMRLSTARALQRNFSYVSFSMILLRPGGFHFLLKTKLGALLTWHFLCFAVLANQSTYLFSPLCEMRVLFITRLHTWQGIYFKTYRNVSFEWLLNRLGNYVSPVFKKYLFIYLIVLGLCWDMGFFSCGILQFKYAFITCFIEGIFVLLLQ